MSSAPTNPKEALIHEVQNEYELIQKRLRELQSLIDQSQAEVRKLQTRSVEITAQVSRIEANFDSVPRNDIKVVYTAALDTRARLLTVQNQLEKFQQDRAQLEHFAQLLENLLKMVAAVPATGIQALPGKADLESEGGGLSNETIIRIVQSQEAERQRLARQMHDGPAQSLTNFILQAEICRRLFDRNPDRAGEELDNLKSAAATTFQKVRDFIFELRPMMLDDLGLAPTMRRYINVFSEKSGIETKINIVGEERRRLEPHHEVMLFRTMQELLGYARDIASATRVDAELDISSNPVRALVTFNGKSLDETESGGEQDKSRVFSLKNLFERLELVGGTIAYDAEGESNRVEIALVAGHREEVR
jgi:two-component system sensor histidine kinase DegS